jgi:hypothetical protein
MIVNQDWRSLLEAQIAAHWEDVCRQAGACLSGSEVRLLEEYGSQALLGGLERSVKARRDMIARTERPTYEVIEESADRVIAEVSSRTRSPYGLCIPLQTMRVHLIAGESGWQIADIFEVCFKCNRSARRDGHSGISDVVERAAPGKCFLCGGSGTMSTSKKCIHCGGTGACPDCAKEEVPGWFRVFCLFALKEPVEPPPREP